MNETTRYTRRQVLGMGSAALGTAALPRFARAADPIVVGYTAVTDFTTLFVAKEEGFFSKRGLEVEPKFIPLNPSIPPAIESDSLQIGGPTPSVYLQGVDGGLDHVVVAGASVTSKSVTSFGLVARPGSGIRTAQDCVGRKIGVPGLGAYLHVTFRAWLKLNGVNPEQVNFVEAAFPQHSDLLRSGSLDAVVSGDPFMARIVAAGTGYVASYYSTFLTDGMPVILYSARRDWAAKNAGAVRSFQQGLAEAADFMNQPANLPRVRTAIGKYIKLPPEVLATMQLNPPSPVVTAKQLSYWVDMMNDQKMLKTTPNVGNLVFK